MTKKVCLIIAVILMTFMLLTLSSCRKNENITFVGEGKERRLLYQDTEYIDLSIFLVTNGDHTPLKNDIELGYYYSFPFSSWYYSYEKDCPDYIYSLGSGPKIYLKKGYDYTSKEFIVNDTSETIIFSHLITGESLGKISLTDVSDERDVVLCSKEHPNLKIPLRVFFLNGKWYARFRDYQVYLISQEFVSLLF